MSAPKLQPSPQEGKAPSTFQGIRQYVLNLFGRSGSAAPPSAAAQEPREAFGDRILVVRGPKRPKYLIQAHIWSPVTFQREDLGDFLVLDMNEGLEEVINWVRSATVKSDSVLKPVIYVIGPNGPLSKDDLRRVNEELVPNGAFFLKRPYDAKTFEDAFSFLREELERQHGTPEQADAWRSSKKKVSEVLVS